MLTLTLRCFRRCRCGRCLQARVLDALDAICCHPELLVQQQVYPEVLGRLLPALTATGTPPPRPPGLQSFSVLGAVL